MLHRFRRRRDTRRGTLLTVAPLEGRSLLNGSPWVTLSAPVPIASVAMPAQATLQIQHGPTTLQVALPTDDSARAARIGDLPGAWTLADRFQVVSIGPTATGAMINLTPASWKGQTEGLWVGRSTNGPGPGPGWRGPFDGSTRIISASSSAGSIDLTGPSATFVEGYSQASPPPPPTRGDGQEAMTDAQGAMSNDPSKGSRDARPDGMKFGFSGYRALMMSASTPPPDFQMLANPSPSTTAPASMTEQASSPATDAKAPPASGRDVSESYGSPLRALPADEHDRIVVRESADRPRTTSLEATDRSRTGDIAPTDRLSASLEAEPRTTDPIEGPMPEPQAADLVSEFLPTSGVALVEAVEEFLETIDDLAPPEPVAPGPPLQIGQSLAWLASGVAIEVVRRGVSRRQKAKEDSPRPDDERPSWPGAPRFVGLPRR